MLSAKMKSSEAVEDSSGNDLINVEETSRRPLNPTDNEFQRGD
jgi:hypothetical protein